MISDDEPDDGTQHYVFVSGFHQAHLIPALAEIGICVDCVIRVEKEEQPPVVTEVKEEEEAEKVAETDQEVPSVEKDSKQLGKAC